ncbi:hypothetical protein J6590_088432 [Homalodisca vitripennis]|nr:hypothetical protein J6590_088432 [Homalodisca vitripennis]
MAFRYTCARYGIRTLFAHKEVNVKVAGTVTVQRLNETAYESRRVMKFLWFNKVSRSRCREEPQIASIPGEASELTSDSNNNASPSLVQV